MTTKSDYPVEKKLAFYRKILIFCFVLLSLVPFGICSVYWICMIDSPFVMELLIPTIILFTVIGVLGAVCLGMYFVK